MSDKAGSLFVGRGDYLEIEERFLDFVRRPVLAKNATTGKTGRRTPLGMTRAYLGVIAMDTKLFVMDSKQRFSDRVENYIRYRPGYPGAIVDLLRDKCGLTPESVIADVGSGTGLLTHLFLENGNVVYGVEPNAAMRNAGEQLLEKYPHFCSVAGSAESTTLPDDTADFILAGQAFHWFDTKGARSEFERISKPEGWVAVIWNERKTDSSNFLREYELFLRTYGTDYAKVSETYPRERQMTEFFGANGFHHSTFMNEQIFDLEGLRGRLLSSSYSPPTDHPQHQPMLAMLKKLFDAHTENGAVRFEYETHVYYGRL